MDNEINSNPLYQPILCPQCGSTKIEFVTEYHKHIWLRAITYIPAIIFIIFLIQYIISRINLTFKDYTDLVIAITAAVFYIGLQIAVWFGESKTHIQGVCRDCGYIWQLN